MGNKTFDFCSKKRIFCPKTTKIGIFGQFGPGHAGFFGALLVGRLVGVARGLYIARHLFTLFNIGEAYFLPIGSIWQSKGEGSKIIDDDKKK